MSSKQMLVIGSTVADIVIHVDKLPGSEDDVHTLSQSIQMGGCAYNVAKMLEFIDYPVTLFSPIGRGIFADFIRANLEKQTIKRINPQSDLENGCCYCFIDPTGERSFLSHHGAEYRFQASWLEALDCSTYDGVYLCGLELEETSGDLLLDFLETHQELRLFFAPGPRIATIPLPRLTRLLALQPLIHLNRRELLAWTREDQLSAALVQLHQHSNQPIVVTLGGDGCVFFDGVSHALSTPRVKIINANGAGDAHFGAFIGTYLQTHDGVIACERANQLASQIVQTEQSTLKKELYHEC